MRNILAIALLLIGTAAAHAQCEAPPTQPSPDGIYFPLGIDPSDGILDVWCRLQSLQGDYKVTVNFLDHKASRSFETSFDGTPSKDRMELASFIQSILPTDDSPALDAQGMNFGSVLEMSVQPRASRTPSSDNVRATALGVPDIYAFANDVVLWAPVTLDISPVKIAGVDFTVRASFRPSFGRYLLAKSGAAEEFVLRGWHRNVLRDAGPFRDNCPANIPACKDLGDVIELHTAWTLNAITFQAVGSGLSNATMQLFAQIASENPKLIRDPLRTFSPTYGKANFTASGEARMIFGEAIGDDAKIAGTQKIVVQWRESPGSKLSYEWFLDDYAKRTREAMVLTNPSQP